MTQCDTEILPTRPSRSVLGFPHVQEDEMDAKITKRTDTSFTIEIDIPYEKASLLEAEELIQQQINKAGTLATGEALTQFDADGRPLWVDG